MRLSEFRRAVDDEYGSRYGRVVTHDLALASLGGRTADEALGEGEEAMAVWLALCEATEVPPDRRYGVGRPLPRR
ncbi:MAG TPA: DUF3046 domain-containing protein [Microbacteriaceae bacterium]|nr:DUF3046 domain-containing protein [Microbacteriaceae bacterium]